MVGSSWKHLKFASNRNRHHHANSSKQSDFVVQQHTFHRSIVIHTNPYSQCQRTWFAFHVNTDSYVCMHTCTPENSNGKHVACIKKNVERKLLSEREKSCARELYYLRNNLNLYVQFCAFFKSHFLYACVQCTCVSLNLDVSCEHTHTQSDCFSATQIIKLFLCDMFWFYDNSLRTLFLHRHLRAYEHMYSVQ